MTNYNILENAIEEYDSRYGDEILNGITTERYRDIIDDLLQTLEDIRFAGRRLPEKDEFDTMAKRAKCFIINCRECLVYDSGANNMNNIIGDMTELFSVYELEEACDEEFLMGTSIITIERMLQKLETEMYHLKDIKEVPATIA